MEPGKARKIQGDGEISFEQGLTAAGREITRMVFESEVLFRIKKRGKDDPRIPDWTILIRAGSEICWPSLVDRRLVSNGFVS